MTSPPRSDLVETLHGVAVADPFRPLEDVEAPATVAWATAQNVRTRAFLDAQPGRADAVAFLRQAMDYERLGVPERFGDIWFAWRQRGLEAQGTLVWRRENETEWRTAIDPNGLSADGTVALSGTFASLEGRRVAYLTSTAGSDWQSLRVRDLASGADLPDVLDKCRFTSVAWHPDGSGFLYSKPIPAAAGNAPQQLRHQLFWHRLGDAQDKDTLVFDLPEQPQAILSPYRSLDGKFFFCIAQAGSDRNNGVYVRPVAGGAFAELFPMGKAQFFPDGQINGLWYALTDEGAPNRKLIAFAPDAPTQWRTIVPESRANLAGWHVEGERIVLIETVDAAMRVASVRLDGSDRREIAVPALSSVTITAGDGKPGSSRVGLYGFTRPLEHYRLDLDASRLVLERGSDAKFDVSDIEVRQIFVTSPDGTRVPTSVMHKRGLKLDGHARGLLTAYGGFGASIMPTLSFEAVLWVRSGGVYAIANIRGGNEYGRAWHEAARKAGRRLVFADFAACAQALVAQGYTRPGRLAIKGGSNGGLLVAAVMQRYPGLVGAVVSEVPVTDMLRFQKFTVGAYWMSEYGDPDVAEDFATLRSYSPLHNIEKGRKYPPILITTADHDDRVLPAHAYKFAAALQEAAPADSTILLRVGMRAGHGAGRPTDKLIGDIADVQAFLDAALPGR
jgi:prolyl oligopeptidase